MSLRIFHIVFIIASVLLSLFVALWGLRQFMDSQSASGLTLGVVFFVFGCALVFYGKRTFRKLKELP